MRDGSGTLLGVFRGCGALRAVFESSYNDFSSIFLSGGLLGPPEGRVSKTMKILKNQRKSMKIIDFFEISLRNRLESSNRCGMVPGRFYECIEAPSNPECRL